MFICTAKVTKAITVPIYIIKMSTISREEEKKWYLCLINDVIICIYYTAKTGCRTGNLKLWRRRKASVFWSWTIFGPYVNRLYSIVRWQTQSMVFGPSSTFSSPGENIWQQWLLVIRHMYITHVYYTCIPISIFPTRRLNAQYYNLKKWNTGYN